MELSDLLNADMATVGAGLRRGWSWWTHELAAMMPQAMRGGSRGAQNLAEFRGGDVVYRVNGRVVAAPPRGGRVAIGLPRAQGLVRDAVLPRLPRADTRRLIALDLDRLTPFDAGGAVFDFDSAAGEAQPGRQQVRLAVITRAAALAALARAATLGLTPRALGLADGAGGIEFDFLPALGEDGPRAPWWARAQTWWIAAGVLLIANILFAVWRDRADVDRLSETVAAQSDAVQLAQRAKSRVRGEDMKRAAWAARRSTQDPLPPLAAATHALPPPVWAQRLGWDGHALRLTGYTSNAIDPIALLRRSGAFAAVHASTSDIAPAMPQFQPFDLTATPTRRAAPTRVTATTTTSTVTVGR